MKLLHLTHESAATNLAIDEALLESAEATGNYPEILRFWEPPNPLVVLGRSSPIEQEANVSYCQSEQIRILRRCSGGQSIVTGPGCLMYAVLLDYRQRPELRMLDQAHLFVMTQMRRAIARLGIEVEMQGTSDLTYQGRKFSGNALRCKKNWFIYHGTMICDFNINLIAKCLGNPIREPAYRAGRSHRDFLTQLPTTSNRLAQAIVDQWGANQELNDWPEEMANRLASKKYANQKWTKNIRWRAVD